MQNNDPSQSPELSRGEQIRGALFELETSLNGIQTPEDVELYAMAAMDRLPEATENAQRIQQLRDTRQDEREAVEEQKKLYEMVKSEIALVTGVELEEARVQRENAQYRERARSIFGTEIATDSRELLVKTGFLLEAPGTEIVFQFPTELFPPHIVEKWDGYLGIVKRHVTAITKRQLGMEDDATAIAQLDKLRTHAHNTVSAAIKEFLDLKDWDLEKSRLFVIKMRDAAIPNIETAEENVTAKAIGRFLTELSVLKEQH